MSRLNRLLRPMTLLDILDGTFDLYKANFAVLVGIVAVIYVPIQALQIAAQILFAGGPEWVPVVINLVYVMLALVASFVVLGPSMWAISEAYLGNKIGIVTAYRRVISQLFPLAITYILWLLAFGIPYLFGVMIMAVGIGVTAVGSTGQSGSAAAIAGMIAAVFLGLAVIFGGLLLFMALLFTCPAVIAEDCRYMSALRRSWTLIKEYYWRTVGITLLAGLLVFIVQIAVDGALAVSTGMLKEMFSGNPYPGRITTAALIYQAGGLLVQVVLKPLVLVTIILLYYDLRIRKEGFDLATLAAEMGYREPEPEEPVSPLVEADAGAAPSEPRPPTL